MPIPNNIKTEHVIKAIAYIDEYNIPEQRISNKYVVAFNNKPYPPKYVLSIANKFANGNELEPHEFSGGMEANSFLKKLGFVIVDEMNDIVNPAIGEALAINFHKTVVAAYNAARKECGYNASVFIQLINEHGAIKVAKDFLTKNTATTGFEKLWEKGRLDLTIEASVLLPQYTSLFSVEERKVAFDRLKEYSYEIQGISFDRSFFKETETLKFIVGEYYSRKDVYKIMNVPESQQGGNWDTGSTRFNGDTFIFANIGVSGRTGHDYPNRFEGNDLIWYGKNGSKLSHDSIKSMINSVGKVYIFAREDSGNPRFIYIGNGNAKNYVDTTPVKIVWGFNDPLENHPEILSEEVTEPQKYREGTVKQVFVNVYERNPLARKKCIEHHGIKCCVCHFDFYAKYGEIGKDFIHVHHLKPLHKIGEKYEVDPIKDLRPVCPNCHAMLHKQKEAYSIEELKMILQKQQQAIPY